MTRGGPGMGGCATRATRIPAGHPEGYFEAFAQLYSDVAEQITAKLEGRDPDSCALLIPGVRDGLAGIRFVNAALESSRQGSAWIKMPGHE
jgi:hypothetical protein